MSGIIISTTYETWDEEALEAGETDDKGYEIEREEYDFRDLVKLFREGGYTQGDTFPSLHSWYSTADSEIDYHTGKMTDRSIHFADIPRKRKYFDLAYRLANKPRT